MINKAKKIVKFADLAAWQEAYSLVLLTHKVTNHFPKEEFYSLTDQMKRAATSVASNAAEGFGRQGYKEKIQFYYLVKGSLTELENQLLIFNGLNYLNQATSSEMQQKVTHTQKLLHGLIRKTKSFINP